MYLCIYIHIHNYIYMRGHTYNKCIHTRVWIHIYMYLHVHISIYIYIHTYKYMQISIYVYIHKYKYMQIYVCMGMCMNIFIYIYVYMYTSLHRYIHVHMYIYLYLQVNTWKHLCMAACWGVRGDCCRGRWWWRVVDGWVVAPWHTWSMVEVYFFVVLIFEHLLRLFATCDYWQSGWWLIERECYVDYVKF